MYAQHVFVKTICSISTKVKTNFDSLLVFCDEIDNITHFSVFVAMVFPLPEDRVYAIFVNTVKPCFLLYVPFI